MPLTITRTLFARGYQSFLICSNRRFGSDTAFLIDGTLLTSGPIKGAFAEVTHAFDESSVAQFARLCGDNNPIHLDAEYAKSTMFKRPIVHGMLVSSLISTLFGRSINSSIYVSQSLHFKAPVYIGTPVTARIEVSSTEDKKKGFLVTCNTTCSLLDEKKTIVVEGLATVLIPKDIYEKLFKKSTTGTN